MLACFAAALLRDALGRLVLLAAVGATLAQVLPAHVTYVWLPLIIDANEHAYVRNSFTQPAG